MCGLQFPRMHVKPVRYQDQLCLAGGPFKPDFGRAAHSSLTLA